MFDKIRSFLNDYWWVLCVAYLAVIIIWGVWAVWAAFNSSPITAHDMGDGVTCYAFNTSVDCLEMGR